MDRILDRRRAKRAIFDDGIPSRRKSQRFSDALMKETKEVWEPDYGRTLTDEEASDIIRNACGFFRAFHMDDEQRKRKKRTE